MPRLPKLSCVLLLPSLILSACLLYYIRIITWTHEDTNITLRVIDNAVNGYGLRWNPDERVQVFTHPLWALLLIPATFICKLFLPASPDLPAFQALYAAHGALSILSITVMLTVLLHHFRRHPVWFATLIILPLFSTAAFTDYASAGLENPLAFALMTLLVNSIYKSPTPTVWFQRSLFATLLIMTRMDLIIILAPAFALTLWPHRRNLPFAPLILGTIPLLAWWAFCIVYYGFIMPNTYYAKISSSFPLTIYLREGLLYVIDFARGSPTGITMLLLAIGWFTTQLAHARAALLSLSLLAGGLAYTLYITYVGGDYMSGRLLSYPFCFLTLVFAYDALRTTHSFHRAGAAMLFAAMILTQPWVSTIEYNFTDSLDITNERYFRITTCSFCPFHIDPTEEGWAIQGMEFRKYAHEHPVNNAVAIIGSVGLTGLFSGPGVIIIDHVRITDPFLSRLPVLGNFRIGHFYTAPPPGYYETRVYNDSSHMESTLAEYYNNLRLITSGPIWTWQRWKQIFAFNTGKKAPPIFTPVQYYIPQ